MRFARIIADADQSTLSQRIKHVEAIATAETVNEQCAVAITQAQPWIPIAPPPAVRGHRATAKEAIATAFSA
jgi:hypothetical protein